MKKIDARMGKHIKEKEEEKAYLVDPTGYH